MFFSWTTVFMGICLIASLRADGSDRYTTKYDNIDLDELLNNDRLRQNYVNCLLDRGSCSPDGAELKSVLPDAITDDCSKCSEKQKVGSQQVIRFLIDNKPNEWAELEAKYDPAGAYKKAYLESKDDSSTTMPSANKK